MMIFIFFRIIFIKIFKISDINMGGCGRKRDFNGVVFFKISDINKKFSYGWVNGGSFVRRGFWRGWYVVDILLKFY